MSIKNVKKDFPLFKRRINDKPIIYLDSTATSLKPRSVIEAVNQYYQKYTANVFRGIYSLSEQATENYEQAREKIARFINAASEQEIIFVRNTTEAINLVAYAWGRLNVSKNDEVVTTIMEHHSNFVPWQMLTAENAAVFKIIDISADGRLAVDKEKLAKIITKRTKLLAITHVSNVLGTINPIKKICRLAKKINPKMKILVDGAQAVPHMKIDVQDLGCDFYAFSGHKMLGPTGIGVLWAKQELLDQMAPFNFGGEMINEVHIDFTTFKKPPHKFEAGTPHIAGAIGLAAAVDYLEKIGMDKVRKHEEDLLAYALQELKKIKLVKIYGPMDIANRSGLIAFNLFTNQGKLIHGHDVAQVLNEDNICIRSGHHCTMPLHERLEVPATARASFYVYNTKEDVDRLVEGLEKVLRLFG